MATTLPSKLYTTSVNGNPSLQMMSDISQDPNSSYLQSQYQEVKSADQLAGLVRNIYSQGDYNLANAQNMLNQGIDYSGGTSGIYSKYNPQARAAAFAKYQSLGNLTPDQINGSNVFDLAGKLGINLGGAGNDYFTSPNKPSSNVMLTPQEQAQLGFSSPFTTQASIDYASPAGQAKAAQESAANLAAIKNGTAPTNAPVVGGSAGNVNAPQAPQIPVQQAPGTSTTNVQTPMGTVQTTTAQPKGNQTTPSLVDYLASAGLPNDLNTRANLATQHGLVPNAAAYLASAKAGTNGNINSQLLSQLRSANPTSSVPDTTAPTPPKITPTSDSTHTSGNPAIDDAFNKAGLTPAQIAAAGSLSPENAVIDYLSKAYEHYGLGGANDAQKQANKEIKDLALKKADEQNVVNNNPWLSQSVRDRTLQQIDKNYATKEAVLAINGQRADGEVARIQSQAQWVAGQAMTLSHEQTVLDEQRWAKAQDIAEKQLEARTTETNKRIDAKTAETNKQTDRIQALKDAKDLAKYNSELKTQNNPVAKFSTTDQQNLIGAGVPSKNISQIETYVNTYGLDAFYKQNPTMPQSMKDTLNKIYGQ